MATKPFSYNVGLQGATNQQFYYEAEMQPQHQYHPSSTVPPSKQSPNYPISYGYPPSQSSYDPAPIPSPPPPNQPTSMTSSGEVYYSTKAADNEGAVGRVDNIGPSGMMTTTTHHHQRERAHYDFDPDSQKLFNAIPMKHKTHEKLQAEIKTIGETVTSTIESGRISSTSGMSYEQFLEGLVARDEKLLVTGHISFNHTTFDPEPESPPMSSMTHGRVYVTGRRLILVSAEDYQGLSLEANSPATPTVYSVTGQSLDAVHYQSIPISAVHSIELKIFSGIKSSGDVKSIKPNKCLACCCSCCGMDMCTKQWKGTGSGSQDASNERLLRMGVEMPPWKHKYMMEIHLSADTSVATVKDFVVALGRFAPNLTYTPVDNEEIQLPSQERI